MPVVSGGLWKGNGKAIAVMGDDFIPSSQSDAQLALIQSRLSQWMDQGLQIIILFDDTGGGLQVKESRQLPLQVVQWIETKANAGIRVQRLGDRLKHLSEIAAAIRTVTGHSSGDLFQSWVSGQYKIPNLARSTWEHCRNELTDFLATSRIPHSRLECEKDSENVVEVLLAECKSIFCELETFFTPTGVSAQIGKPFGKHSASPTAQLVQVFRLLSPPFQSHFGARLLELDGYCAAVTLLLPVSRALHSSERVLLACSHALTVDAKLTIFLPLLLPEVIRVEAKASPTPVATSAPAGSARVPPAPTNLATENLAMFRKLIFIITRIILIRCCCFVLYFCSVWFDVDCIYDAYLGAVFKFANHNRQKAVIFIVVYLKCVASPAAAVIVADMKDTKKKKKNKKKTNAPESAASFPNSSPNAYPVITGFAPLQASATSSCTNNSTTHRPTVAIEEEKHWMIVSENSRFVPLVASQLHQIFDGLNKSKAKKKAHKKKKSTRVAALAASLNSVIVSTSSETRAEATNSESDSDGDGSGRGYCN
jgi:hypothetical protein